MGQRRSKAEDYTKNQLWGMRILGWILRQARLNHSHSTLRAFSQWLLETHGEKFHRSRISIYERAGGQTDLRSGQIDAIHPKFLELVQPLTPYSLSELRDLNSGETVALIEEAQVKPLSELITEKEKQLGSTKFKKKMIELELKESDIDLAKTGNLTGDHVTIALSALLGIPADEVRLAAIAQLKTNPKLRPPGYLDRPEKN